MKRVRSAHPYLFAALLYVAAALQASIGPRVGLGLFKLDLPLVILAVFATNAGKRGGAIMGFFDGLVMGALSGADIQHYIFGRTLAGFLLGWFGTQELRYSAPVIAIAAVGATLVSRFAMLLLAPPPGISGYLADTIGSAMYNGVIAIAVYALLKRTLAPAAR